MTKVGENYPNGRCCVFLPFDNGGDFEKRFDDTLAPAIKAAGMEPYRVDRDAGSVIPVDSLHQEIRSAVICLADITTRNPNVMYELGYSIAAAKDVVIISAPSAEKYPFDIQHRGIISYAVGSMSDFKRLEQLLTDKLTAILERQEKTTTIASISSASPVKSSDGLEPHELTALALLLANSDSTDDFVSANWLKEQMRKSGYTDVSARLAMVRLTLLGYALNRWHEDSNERYVVYGVTESGEQWLLENQSKLKLREPERLSAEASAEITDDDIPF